MKPLPIYFVRLMKKQVFGSTRMRGVELIDLIEPHLPKDLQARQILMPKRTHPIAQRLWARLVPSDAIYFFTKQAAKNLDHKAGRILENRARAICFDYVDGDPKDFPADLASVHICTSYAQEDSLRRLQQIGEFAPGPTHVILHNASAELMRQSIQPASSFSTCYLGTASMTYIPDALADDVEFIDASNSAVFKKNLHRIPNFSLHYCFRRNHGKSDSVVKPFTKGVTAAVCSANVITSRTVPDAEKLLGSDYPFFVDDNSADNIMAAFERAKSSFGTPVWKDALSSMDRIKKMVSGPSLANAFSELAQIAGAK